MHIGVRDRAAIHPSASGIESLMNGDWLPIWCSSVRASRDRFHSNCPCFERRWSAVGYRTCSYCILSTLRRR